MFVVTGAEAAAIRAAFDRGGELSAAVELRRAVPRRDRHCAGAGVRSYHRRLRSRWRRDRPGRCRAAVGIARLVLHELPSTSLFERPVRARGTESFSAAIFHLLSVWWPLREGPSLTPDAVTERLHYSFRKGKYICLRPRTCRNSAAHP
jgi:hypothetical protein